MKTKQTQNKFLISIVLLLSIAVVSTGGYFYWVTMRQKTDVDTIKVKEDAYYHIRNNATQIQKELYETLKEAIEKEPSNQLEIADLVAKNYVADFYTWTNKLRINDVGGLQFVHNDLKASVYLQAQESFYYDMYYYLNQDGLHSTLEVSQVTSINAKESTFFLFDEEGVESQYDPVSKEEVTGTNVDAVEVSLRWNYAPSNSVDVTNYSNEATFVLIKNDKDLYVIVEVSHEQETL